MRKPPPTTKGQSNMKMILETLPNRGDTAKSVMMLWVLSQRYSTFVSLFFIQQIINKIFGKNSLYYTIKIHSFVAVCRFHWVITLNDSASLQSKR